jgi:hypothetical protein
MRQNMRGQRIEKCGPIRAWARHWVLKQLLRNVIM